MFNLQLLYIDVTCSTSASAIVRQYRTITGLNSIYPKRHTFIFVLIKVKYSYYTFYGSNDNYKWNYGVTGIRPIIVHFVTLRKSLFNSNGISLFLASLLVDAFSYVSRVFTDTHTYSSNKCSDRNLEV